MWVASACFQKVFQRGLNSQRPGSVLQNWHGITLCYYMYCWVCSPQLILIEHLNVRRHVLDWRQPFQTKTHFHGQVQENLAQLDTLRANNHSRHSLIRSHQLFTMFCGTVLVAQNIINYLASPIWQKNLFCYGVSLVHRNSFLWQVRISAELSPSAEPSLYFLCYLSDCAVVFSKCQHLIVSDHTIRTSPCISNNKTHITLHFVAVQLLPFTFANKKIVLMKLIIWFLGGRDSRTGWCLILAAVLWRCWHQQVKIRWERDYIHFKRYSRLLSVICGYKGTRCCFIQKSVNELFQVL